MTTAASHPGPRPPASGLKATLAAVEGLERLLGSGSFQEGDRLPPERELARQIGCSRPTVRAALQALSLIGIIESRQGSGNYIRHFDDTLLGHSLRWWMRVAPVADEVIAILEVREVVESGLARLAASRITDDALERLQQLSRELQEVESPEDVLRVDLAMHDVIAEQSGNRFLVSILRSVRDLNAVSRFRTIATPGVKEDVATDQQEVVAALLRRDPEAAARAMWNHIERILVTYQGDQPDQATKT